jgi:hypothetical protein
VHFDGDLINFVKKRGVLDGDVAGQREFTYRLNIIVGISSSRLNGMLCFYISESTECM